MKRTFLVLGGVLLLGLAGVLVLSRTAHRGNPSGGGESMGGAPSKSSLQEGATAPSFLLKDISGNIVDSSRFSGKPTVINFFATWCPPCREEIPGFVDVYNKYREEGFELVGISLDTDTRENLPQFIMSHRIGFRILVGDLSTTKAYGGVSSIPTTVFIGKDGRIKYVHVGYLDRDAFDREVKKLL